MKALVEGVEMSVCKGCASFGRILQAPRMPSKTQGHSFSRSKEPQIVESIVEEYAQKITRLGRGIPTGGEIEFADEETLGQAIDKRS